MYRSIFTLGQSLQHHQQIQHPQHTLTQDPVCFLQPTVIGIRKQHIHMALSRYNYLDRVFHKLQTKLDFQLSQQQCHNNINLHRDTNKNNNIFTVVAYSKGLSESFRNICGKAGVQVHFKGANTIKEIWVAPTCKDSICNKGGVIYRYRCEQSMWTMEYVEETGRNFW